jgi:hypothetical protein
MSFALKDRVLSKIAELATTTFTKDNINSHLVRPPCLPFSPSSPSPFALSSHAVSFRRLPT